LPAALTLSQMGPEERKEGIASLEKYVQQNPKSHDARLALAQMYLASDRLDDAQKQFEIMHKNNARPHAADGARADQDPAEEFQRRADLPDPVRTASRKNAERRSGPGVYLSCATVARTEERGGSEQLAEQGFDQSSQQYMPAQITRAQLLAKQGKTEDARKLLAGLQAPDPRDQALIARTDAAILFDASATRRRNTPATSNGVSPTIPISPTTTPWPPKKPAITTSWKRSCAS
jgi:Tetratricopeptide repeat.